MSKSQLHAVYYALLIVFMGTALWFFTANSGFPDVQFRIVLITAAGYLLWGMFFHLSKGDLHLKIVIEYLAIAALAVILMRGAIFR